MDVGAGIAFGLTAAVCWGVADFCARGASRTGGTFLTLLWIEIIAVVGVLLVNIPLGMISLAHATPGAVAAAVVISLAIMGGAALLYRAFAVGTLALVSPIASSFAALTALLAIGTGERPDAGQLVGIVLTLAGVVLASAVPADQPPAPPEVAVLADIPHSVAGAMEAKSAYGAKRWRPAPGLVEALGAMLVFGVSYWALRYVVADLGGMTVVFLAKAADLVAVALIALVGLALPRRGPSGSLAWYAPRRPVSAFWVFVVPTALLDTAANLAYNLGVASSLTSVVSVLSSLFSAVTVLLAWIFLRERLAGWQWAGVVAILAGIALVSL